MDRNGNLPPKYLAVALLLLSIAQIDAQVTGNPSAHARIVGTVLDRQGQPLKNIFVHAVSEVTGNLPLDQLKNHFDAIESAAYSVSLFTDWQKRRVNEVWLKTVANTSKPFDAPEEFFGAKRTSKNLHPIAELSAENCTQQMGVPGPRYDRLPHFRMGFTPSAEQRTTIRIFRS